MATFKKYQRQELLQEFTEPCMNCFASVTYNKNEVQMSNSVAGRKSIICPNCGEEMFVNFCNILLC